MILDRGNSISRPSFHDGPGGYGGWDEDGPKNMRVDCVGDWALEPRMFVTLAQQQKNDVSEAACGQQAMGDTGGRMGAQQCDQREKLKWQQALEQTCSA